MSDPCVMSLFRRKRAPGWAGATLNQAKALHPSRAGIGPAVTPVKRVKLRKEDWNEIGDMLSKAPERVPATAADARLAELERTLGELRSFTHGERIVGAGHARNWLLDLWSIAQQIDSSAARPTEVLLTRLVGRDVVNADEIYDVCTRTERAALAGRARCQP